MIELYELTKFELKDLPKGTTNCPLCGAKNQENGRVIKCESCGELFRK